MNEWQVNALKTMLKSFGLEAVITEAQKFVTNGTMDKILKFADGLEELNARFDRIERLLNGQRGETIEGTAIAVEPGPGPGDGERRHSLNGSAGQNVLEKRDAN